MPVVSSLHTLEGERYCPTCDKYRPLSSFRRRSKSSSSRMSNCRDCHNRQERERRRSVRAKSDRKVLQRFATRVNSAGTNAQVSAVCNEMYLHFGGLDRFTRAWRQALTEAGERSPGSRFVLTSYLAFLRLMEYRRAAEVDIASLDDDETREFICEHLFNLLIERLELLPNILRAAGWKVEPPDNDDDWFDDIDDEE